MKQNKTKIIATIGPASSSKEVMKQMMEEGVNVFRINFSHGNYEEYKKIITTINELNEELHLHTAILADLQGPKMRIGEVENNKVLLETGREIIITTEKIVGTAEKIYLTYSKFPEDVKKGETVLIDDGKIVLEVMEIISKTEVKAIIIEGGQLSSKKGFNLPNTKISLPSLTEKDLKDLDFALEQNVPWIGLSFVRSARDIIELKQIISLHINSAKVVAKIEKPEAVSEIDDIIKETDAVMVARGDLGVEMPMQDLPIIQKMLVGKCLKAAKPVIIATQMMESMMEHLTPTRAEVNDVANAVMDGADAIMLSGETSVGKHPVEVIKAAYKIVLKAESYPNIYNRKHQLEIGTDRFISDSMCDNACYLARKVNAKAIVTNTFSGYTAFRVACYRPKAGIYVFTANRKILNMLSLIWGVKGFYYDKFVSTDHTIADIKFILRKKGILKENDLVINIASMPITEKGMTNMIKLSKI